jgi:alpha-1,3-rhamnosyltransferase
LFLENYYLVHMNNSPLVSIIIPSYNHQNYVTYTLNSIIKDTYANKEIVIINDGSTDDTNNVINSWIALNTSVIKITYINRENKGICATLNEAIGLANGKYILLVASDDALYGNTIAQRVDILEENEGNGKLVLISDALIIDENNNIIGQSSMAINKGNKLKFKTDIGILEEMITNPSTVGPVAFINKSVYNKIGSYPEDLVCEDWFFYQRAASIKTIMFWDKTVALYRVHSKNMSGADISLKRKIDIYNSVKISILRNISSFPSLYLKLLGILKLSKIEYLILKLKLKKTYFNIKNYTL